jgi:hypothetical protein
VPERDRGCRQQLQTFEGLGVSGTLRCRCSRDSPNIAKNATVNASNGEATIAISAVSTTPQLMAERPPAASPAPTKPPMIAWLEEDGMPTYQVR